MQESNLDTLPVTSAQITASFHPALQSDSLIAIKQLDITKCTFLQLHCDRVLHESILIRQVVKNNEFGRVHNLLIWFVSTERVSRTMVGMTE